MIRQIGVSRYKSYTVAGLSLGLIFGRSLIFNSNALGRFTCSHPIKNYVLGQFNAYCWIYSIGFSSTRHLGNLVYQVFRFKASINSSQLRESAIIASCAMLDTRETHPFYYYFPMYDVFPPLGASHPHILLLRHYNTIVTNDAL